MRVLPTLGAAVRGCRRKWRASLVVLGLLAVPLVAPFVLMQAITALTMRGGLGDPVLMQHALWIMGDPGAVSIGFELWLLFFGPWAIGTWGASGTHLRLRIGWEVYARFLVVLCCVAVITKVDSVVLAVVGPSFGVILALEVLADAVALYVFLRLAGTGPVVRDGGQLDLVGAWRDSAPRRGALLVLTVVWMLLGAVFSVLAEIAALLASQWMLAMDVTPSATLHFITLGAPGLIVGGAAALIVLMTIALFWTVGEDSDA